MTPLTAADGPGRHTRASRASLRVRDDAGVSTVEFALVLPVFLVLIGIGAFFAWTAYVQAQVDRAAERAARYAAVPTSAGVWSFCRSDVLNLINNDVLSNDIADRELTLLDRKTAAPATCPAKQPTGYVRVRIAHTFSNPFTPLVSFLTPVDGTFTVTGTGQARVEAP